LYGTGLGRTTGKRGGRGKPLHPHPALRATLSH